VNDFHDLCLLLRSRFPLLLVETQEEARLLALVERACGEEQWPLFTWSVADGLRRRSGALVDTIEAGTETRELEAALRHIAQSMHVGIYVLFDAHGFLQQPANQRLVKQIALEYAKRARTLVFVGHRLELPQELRRMSARFGLSLPDAAELKRILREEIAAWEAEPRLGKLRGEPEAATMLLQHLVGLSADDARRHIRHAIRDDGMLTRADIPRLLKAKHEALGQSGVLTLELETASFAEVAGLDALRRWLERRRAAFRGELAGLDPPRGVLLLGVQGAGKSLACKAIAGSWQLPLLRLDAGALYSKWIGETEANLREALRAAEALAPCVLWIDEIEKAFAPEGDGSDGGVGRRVLGGLLTWMNERRSRVFLAATANDISALPPELLRKGRFDEIFFVDLPGAAARAEIFRIHLQRRKQPAAGFELAALAAASEGFSGAEIEQAVVSGLYEAAALSQPLTTALLQEELARTRSLSVVMAEKIEALRAWAQGRTVPAG